LCGEFAPQGAGIHVVDESPLPVDLDDGEPFPVARFQLRIAADVHRLELERHLRPNVFDDLERTLAKVATLCVVEDNLRDRFRA